VTKLECVIWLFTGACNLSCEHCYAYRFRGAAELSLREKLRLAKEAGELGVEYVNLSGGEPLAHPHLAPILEALHECGVEKSVVTNATLVNDRVLELLSRTETYPIVSLDGPREVHERVRGPGTYEAAIRGLKLLLERVGAASVVAAVSKLNHGRVHEVADIAADAGVDGVALIPVMPAGRARETGVSVEAGEYLGAVLRAAERARERGIRLSLWCTPWAPILRLGLRSWFCRVANVIDIAPSGDTLLCDVLDFTTSSVRGKSLSEAYREALNHPLIKLVAQPPRLPEPCASCPLAGSCRGGCFARAFLVKGDFNAGDPLCPKVAQLEVPG